MYFIHCHLFIPLSRHECIVLCLNVRRYSLVSRLVNIWYRVIAYLYVIWLRLLCIHACSWGMGGNRVFCLIVFFWEDCWSLCGRLTVNSLTVQDRRGQDEHVEVVPNAFWVRLESADTDRWAQSVRWRSQSHLSNTDRHGHGSWLLSTGGGGGVRNKISCVSMHTLRMSDTWRRSLTNTKLKHKQKRNNDFVLHLHFFLARSIRLSLSHHLKLLNHKL